MRHGRHAPGQCGQHGGSAADGIGLQGLASGEHEDDKRARQVLAQHDRRDDRDPGEQIRIELAPQQLEQQPEDKGKARGNKSENERKVGKLDAEHVAGSTNPETQDEMTGNGHDRDARENDLTAVRAPAFPLSRLVCCCSYVPRWTHDAVQSRVPGARCLWSWITFFPSRTVQTPGTRPI